MKLPPFPLFLNPIPSPLSYQVCQIYKSIGISFLEICKNKMIRKKDQISADKGRLYYVQVLPCLVCVWGVDSPELCDEHPHNIT